MGGWLTRGEEGGEGVVTLPLYDGSWPGWSDSLEFKLNRKTSSQPSVHISDRTGLAPSAGFEVYNIHEKIKPSQSPITVLPVASICIS